MGGARLAGSVEVVEFGEVERYSHVWHIVSTVESRVAEGMDAFDVLTATFPAGTLTGAPKVRAMELIDELEPVRRGNPAPRLRARHVRMLRERLHDLGRRLYDAPVRRR